MAGVTAARLSDTLAALPQGALAPAAADGRDRLAHAVARLTYGITPDLHGEAQRLGVDAFIAQQLTPNALDDSALDAPLAPWRAILDATPAALFAQYENDRDVIVGALTGGTTIRAMHSTRQLHERMVYFFSNHFNVYIGKAITVFLKVEEDRLVIRPNTMTTFRQILGASAKSPAMLVYLDNARSDKRSPNENYARELLELHTMGVNGGYSEDDVKAVARAFTGWSMRGRTEGDNAFTYAYRRGFHDDDAKTILGAIIPAGGGERDGELVLDLLAAHPSTARTLATKIARRFVADAPPEALVERLAAGFLVSGGDITSLLRDLFAADEFWDAPPKLKHPFEYVVSVLRALSFQVSNEQRFGRTISGALEAMGNLPFAWPAPNGYPDVAGAWRDGLITRWNAAISAVSGDIGGAGMDIDRVLRLFDDNGVPFETEPVVNFMGGYLLGRPLTSDESGVTVRFARESGDGVDAQIASGIALLLASPAFQYR
ncbi:MAG: DUF1800 domain-containing protein [Chloroflexota bacterium]|nr:DUF1800 domain-containing protein [Chloroflexota bacterium]